jgi:cytochrome c oxidase subunit 2
MPIEKAFHFRPDAAATAAGRVDLLLLFLTAVSVFFTVLILVLIVYFALRYRRRSEDEIPPEAKQRIWLEITWTIIPFGIVMVMFVWGSHLYVWMKRPPKDAIEMNVVGKQWMWKVQHPGGQSEIDELHVPAGRAVKLVMSSQDVIHDFSIPAFRIKQDVLPGSFVTEWFEATKPGEYHLFCAEYCGTGHSRMVGRVVVMAPEQYQDWLASVAPGEAPAVAGSRLFTSLGCAQCHGQVAPTLAGLFGRNVQLQDGSARTADEQYLRESILNPPEQVVRGYPVVMPSYRGQIDEEQLGQLIAYIKSLGSARAGDADGAGAPAADSAAPASRPATGYPRTALPNQPPARGSGANPPPGPVRAGPGGAQQP